MENKLVATMMVEEKVSAMVEERGGDEPDFFFQIKKMGVN